MQHPARQHTPWRDVPEVDWSDWRWQLRHSVRDVEALREVVRLTPDEIAGVEWAAGGFSMSITPYYAALMDPEDSWCPIRRMAVPTASEAIAGPGERRDPLAEERHEVVPGLVRRYPDRALLLVHPRCATNCRFCTRRRWAGRDGAPLTEAALDRVVAWLRAHPEVRDVLVSGGDPLLLSDDRLGRLLSALRGIDSVKLVRVGTRVPAVLPQRVTKRLAATLAAHGPVWVVTHFDHPKELTSEARAACARLADAGLPLANQTVLLRRLNSSAEILRELWTELVSLRVHPYYLHQCDLAEGLEGFRTPVAEGVHILEALRGRTSGLAIPTFVLDLPEGGGKVPLLPRYLEEESADHVTLRTLDGGRATWPEPADPECGCPYQAVSRRR